MTALNIVGALLLSWLYDFQGHSQLALGILVLWLVGPLTPLVALITELSNRPASALRYLLTATVAYGSLVPILAARVVAQGLGRRAPSFEVTGAVARQPAPFVRYAAIVTSGSCTLLAAVALRSPALAPLLCFSLMLVSGPLMSLTERDDALGVLGRNCSFLPFAALIGYLNWGA